MRRNSTRQSESPRTMMNCSCRATPLRIFIQSLTDLRLSNPATAITTRRIQFSYPRATGCQLRCSPSQPFSAAASLGLPGTTTPDEPATRSPAHGQSAEAPRRSPSDGSTAGRRRGRLFEVSEDAVAKGKLQGAIAELSLESIDALLEDADRNSLPAKKKKKKKSHARPVTDRKATAPFPKISRHLDPERDAQSDEQGLPALGSKGPKRLKRKARHSKDTRSAVGPVLETQSDMGTLPAADSQLEAPVLPSKLKRRKIVGRLRTKKKTGASKMPAKLRRQPWFIQKEALQQKFPEGWNPRKRLSPDAIQGIRALNAQFPDQYRTEALARKFEVSPEAIRRILRTKWTPSAEEEIDRQERWFKRGKKVWARKVLLGVKAPKRWRKEGIVRDPYWNRPRGQPTPRRRPLRPNEIPFVNL
ncbi:hypothetical protein GGS23DRAFT_567202 [Durotheca rogersii]|uniref:uncharacterized protein n=1 Tax=Durotheca rogersii TaxID=419775 RepID=UPI00221F2F60|nr:uncharacterized protein GGS23DRAFT_567202 [Durotheca rogersii]KAI5863468.1 hypothetical protein GGS23DRAFT_567202 [Durotheca rogersii]